MKTIILDTNFLVYCVKYRIDFFSEIERICDFQFKLCVLDKSIEELERLKPKELNLIKKFIETLEILKSKEYLVDDELTRLSEENCIVATQDKELKDRLKNQIIVIRKKKYLELK